jgi:hypothetical protein
MNSTKGSVRARLLTSTLLAGLSVAAPLALTAIVSAVPTVASAQQQTGALRITVRGNNGAPVSAATVTVSSPDSLVAKTGTTDQDGRVRISGLDPATNYTVKVSAGGYTDFSGSNVAVVSGKDLSVGYALASDANAVEEIVVTGTSLAAVDVTSATVSTTLTLGVVESLPTGRNYQSYLQLVPGVKPSTGGNPSSRSGVNYADVDGATGASSDNVYYLDGVDVTDPTSGLAGAGFNSEIIQEQQVIVDGVGAEYAGGSGLISRVVTKSGSNDWHGSVNYYLQNDSLVAKDKHLTSGGFKTYDTAFTLGGPIIEDKLWVYGSYQKKYRKEDIQNGTSTGILRSPTDISKYAFFKTTWQITDNDRLTGTFFNDPRKISGSALSTTPNNRDLATKRGGDNYKIDYAKTWGNLQTNAYYYQHDGEITQVAADQSVRDNLTFQNDANSVVSQRQLGGTGSNIETHRNRKEFGLNGEYYLDTGFGSHTFKAGYVNSKNIYEEEGTVPGGVTYASLAAQYAGKTYADYTGLIVGNVTPPALTARSITQNDNPRILTAVNANATARAALDTDASGSVSVAELNASRFTSTAGNPYSNVNVYRTLRTIDSPYSVESKGQTLYVQDTWTLNQLTVQAGVRAEKWDHYASDKSKVATFDWDLAPRFSVTYDVFGDGRSKVFGFLGRYYDPVRNNMSDFAGALTGPVDEEQVFLGGQWITFRTRGGATTPDALFSPTTKTPYTDEYMIGASTTIGSSIGVSATITHRETRDILEDFDLTLYSDPTLTAATAPDGYAYPGSAFYLPYSYFGYSTKPNSNYVLGTLPGGERNYTGFEFVVTKYKTGKWQGQASYTHNKAAGNSNSDSNADYQGDWIALDPRAPNAYGPQPGNIKHQFKAYGSYDLPFGIQTSGVFNWNSGTIYTPAEVVARRYFAPMAAPYAYGGVVDSYYKPGGIGSGKAPAYYTFDMRVKYVRDLPIGKAEFFLDIFNVLNKQSATDEMKVIAGDGTYDFQEANAWVQPRRLYLGVRYAF